MLFAAVKGDDRLHQSPLEFVHEVHLVEGDHVPNKKPCLVVVPKSNGKDSKTESLFREEHQQHMRRHSMTIPTMETMDPSLPPVYPVSWRGIYRVLLLCVEDFHH